MKKDFKEIVQAMTAKEIIMSMVLGLEKPYTKIEMSTYGYKDPDSDICYGCAATNTICKIMAKERPQTKRLLRRLNGSCVTEGFAPTKISSDRIFVQDFENAINFLRFGLINEYNCKAGKSGFAKILFGLEIYLPTLYDDYTKRDLEPYKLLAEAQKS